MRDQIEGSPEPLLHQGRMVLESFKGKHSIALPVEGGNLTKRRWQVFVKKKCLPKKMSKYL